MIHVVAAAVTASDGSVLIAERPSGKQLAGHWEFPGGKLETGETRAQGLARELSEELGITIREPRPLMRVRHTYEFGEVLLDMWVVSRYRGEPQGLDGQRLRWCTLDELSHADLLLADRPLVRALRLPPRLIRSAADGYCIDGSATTLGAKLRGEFCANLEEGVAAGNRAVLPAEFLVMRSAIDRGELATLCDSVGIPVFGVGLTLEDAWQTGATGVSELG